MTFFSKRIIGIDIHDYSAEIVELVQKGNLVSLEAYNRSLVPGTVIKNGEIKKPEELKSLLSDLIKTANPRPIETHEAALVLPSSKVLTHIFTFPANLCDKEIKKSIEYEVEKVIPFSLEDIYWDYIFIKKGEPSDKKSTQKVFFACVNKQIADQYTELIESIGLTPIAFSINAETLLHAVRKQLDETTLIIDVESLSVNYLIVENGTISYFYSTNEGGKKLITTLAKELQTPENIILEKKEQNNFKNMPNLEEISNFMKNNYQHACTIIKELQEEKRIKEVKTIILTGEFLNLPNFYETAKIYFPNQHIHIGEPKNNLNIDQEKFMAIDVKEEKAMPYSTHFVNAIGVAFRGLLGEVTSETINLLPGRLKERFMNKRFSTILSAVAVSLTVLSLIMSTLIVYKHQIHKYKYVDLEIQKEAIEKMIYGTRYRQIYEEITNFNNEIAKLRMIDAQLFSLPITLDSILKAIPSDIELKSLEFNDVDLTVSLTGIANNRKQLLELQNNFEKTEEIEEVFAPISNFDEKSQISFLIQAKLDYKKLLPYDADTNTQ